MLHAENSDIDDLFKNKQHEINWYFFSKNPNIFVIK